MTKWVPKSFGAMFFLLNEFSLKVGYIDKNTCFVVNPKMENDWLFGGITGIRFAKNMISHLQPKVSSGNCWSRFVSRNWRGERVVEIVGPNTHR